VLNTDVKSLIDQGERLFTKRAGLMSLMQEIAQNFYPEAAEFTVNRTLGQDFSADLMTSYPVLARRELGDGFGSMLRPTSKEWFAMGVKYRQPDLEGRAWLERSTRILKNAMYDRRSQFLRATKEGDHFFGTFGQCVITVEMRKDMDGLLYRHWHLKDVAWCEDAEGVIDSVHHKMKFTVQQVAAMFPGKLSATMQQKLQQDPYCDAEIRRIVVPSEMYRGEKKWNTKYVSLYVDVQGAHVLEEMGQKSHPYVIPRWRTTPGSQYAYSPAAMTALPDARLMQAMTLVLLEAGEKAVNPPIMANKEVFRSDLPMYAGGLTWADMAYDGRISDHFAVLAQDKSGIPLGMEMREDIRNMVMQAFYLNKLNLPSYDSKAMTAYEFGQRVQEYIRQVLPLFEPMESEYNGPLCDRSFDLLLNVGGFGPPDEIPESLRGAETDFHFQSPMSDAIQKQKATTFREDLGLIAEAAALDPSAPVVFDAAVALRDALEANLSPASWMRSPEAVEAILAKQAQQQQTAQLLEAMGQAATVAKTGAETQAIAAGV
jgi:hypothetical protein